MRLEHWLYTVPLRLRSLFRRRRVEQELDEELRYHLEEAIRERTDSGMSAEQARRERPARDSAGSIRQRRAVAMLAE